MQLGRLPMVLVLTVSGCMANVSEDGQEAPGGESPGEPEAPPVDAESGAAGQGAAIVIESPSVESLEEAERAAKDELVLKSCSVPSDHEGHFEVATNMGSWSCSTFCDAGQSVASWAIKSLSHQGSGDDLANTGIAAGCHNMSTGAFVEWKMPFGVSSAPGAWDITTSSCFLKGANFKMFDGPTSGIDDVGITDAAGLCLDDFSINVDVNNPGWGTWRGWDTCPSGTRVCGVGSKLDPDDSSDDAGMTGVRVECCDR